MAVHPSFPRRLFRRSRLTRLLTGISLLLIGLPTAALATNSSENTLVPTVRTDVVARTDGKISAYAFDLTLDPAGQTISGTESVNFINETGESLSEIPFRLYPNADYYGSAMLDVVRARVKGKLATPLYSAQDTVMIVPLATSLAPGEQVEIDIRFTVTVPTDSTGTFGIFSFDAGRGTWILADWYPILAGWEPGRGWVLDTPTAAGDPTFSDVASYNLNLELPSDLTIAATGMETVVEIDGDRTRWQIASGPVREFTMVLDDDFETTTRRVGETAITFYADGSAAASGAALALDAAAEALAVYSETFGIYPYKELDLVETEMAGALGVSWTGLVYLNGAEFLSSAFFVDEQPDRLRFTVAHEIGHQWWGAMVGINSNDHTFLLEGLTNYLAIYATEQTQGEAAAAEQLSLQCVQPYLRALAESGDGIPDTSINEPMTGGPSRSVLVYGKAALGFLAIRQRIGDDAFFGAIRAWADEFSFAIAGPEDLLAAFEKESGTQLGDLWASWFQSANTTEADVLALLEA